MIPLSTCHAHTTFSDGKNTPEEMILAAIERGWTEIGISDHSHLEGEDWCLIPERYGEYVSTLEDLREKYSGKIKLRIGMEQDYLSEPFPQKLDYIIGSVHAIKFEDGFECVDLSIEHTKSIIENHFNGDPYLYVEEYYKSVADLYNRTHCNIIGHFDLVSKFVELDPFIDVKNKRYINARDKALHALLSAPVAFEVNTGAISRGYRTTPYPEIDVLKQISKAGKKVIITSDSHSVETIDFELNKTAKELDKLGIIYARTLDELI